MVKEREKSLQGHGPRLPRSQGG